MWGNYPTRWGRQPPTGGKHPPGLERHPPVWGRNPLVYWDKSSSVRKSSSRMSSLPRDHLPQGSHHTRLPILYTALFYPLNTELNAVLNAVLYCTLYWTLNLTLYCTESCTNHWTAVQCIFRVIPWDSLPSCPKLWLAQKVNNTKLLLDRIIRLVQIKLYIYLI